MYSSISTFHKCEKLLNPKFGREGEASSVLHVKRHKTLKSGTGSALQTVTFHSRGNMVITYITFT